MRKIGNTKGGKNKNKTKEKTTNQYLKEILINIENIQSTILKKLEKTAKHDEVYTIPLTPKRQNVKPLQSHSNRKIKFNNFNSKQSTPKKISKVCPETKKYPQNSFVLFHEDANLTKYSSNPHSGKKQSTSKTNKEKVKTQNFINYYTVRCKQKTTSKDKASQFRSITERIGNQEQIKCQRKILSAKQIQLIQKLDNKTQNSINIQQTTNSHMKNEIQLFYKNEINKLEVDQKIKQLQSQLQNCLSNKKVANLSEFHFIRSRMKRISVEINQLKQKRYTMKRQMMK